MMDGPPSEEGVLALLPPPPPVVVVVVVVVVVAGPKVAESPSAPEDNRAARPALHKAVAMLTPPSVSRRVVATVGQVDGMR